MEVRQAIAALRLTLENTRAEEELLTAITGSLDELRRRYRRNRLAFTHADIEFLKTLNGIAAHLRTFMDIKDELLYVGSLDEYQDTMERLTRVKEALAGLPVARRVAKEIRELHERLPAIRSQDEAQRNSRLAI